MPVFRLSEQPTFPPPQMASASGLLAIGGDLSLPRLLNAYASGIFPWPHEDSPLLWHSPDPRFVLLPKELRLARSLRQTIRKRRFELRTDTAFERVIRACAEFPRPGQRGTWITEEMVKGYCELHEAGFAHSVEAWQEGVLVGGLYGVSLGAAFFGESMFAHVSDASKVAFACFVRQLERLNFAFIDSQVHTQHLERFGASFWSRARYLKELRLALQTPTLHGRWRFSFDELIDAEKA
ncbi:MAG: leucyl/phenylalanyl-tRNA--protein transferase [Myxococcota bacterium]|jgi:leucyl/phenylalanyl-tRNA--protein transferase|nr:leucyl/phenylalanyl-tRNA--protein transferase [Myxococcota bacterium]